MIGVAIGPPVLQDANPDGRDLVPLGIAQDISDVSTETTEQGYRSEPGFIATPSLENKRLNISRMVLKDPRLAEQIYIRNRPFGVFLQVQNDVRPTQGYLSDCYCLNMECNWTSKSVCEAREIIFRYDKMDKVDERRSYLPWSAFEPDPMGIRGSDRASGPSRTVVDMGRKTDEEKEFVIYGESGTVDWVALRDASRAKTAKEQRFFGMDKAAAGQDKTATWMTQEDMTRQLTGEQQRKAKFEEMQRLLVDGELGAYREAADLADAAQYKAGDIIRGGDKVYVATGQGSNTTTLKMYGDKSPTPDPQPTPAPKRPAPQPLVDDDRPRLVRQGASLDELEQGDEALVARQVRLVPQIEETEEPAAVRAVRSAT